MEGETLFVTFNEQLLGRYADEAVIFSTDYSQGEGRLRRRLAMAALVNTLTESGLYSRVQVLVRQESYITSSMRLSMRYYLLEDDSLPPPLTRQESYILTPQVSAQIFWRAGAAVISRPVCGWCAAAKAAPLLPSLRNSNFGR